MQDFVTTVMAPEFLATLFAAICAFATILTFGLPYLEKDRANQRMRVMAVERDKLRSERLKEMSVADRSGGSGGKLRQAPKGFVLRLVEQLNLREKFDSEAVRAKLKTAGFRSEAHLATYMAYRVICPPALFVISLVY
ncbi:MAG: type II secretion system F family protein, partial [Hyphomicrobiaceae bacterium]|nr:type II secretion system F family protein [Hyphomicrobiaceae bacterium]